MALDHAPVLVLFDIDGTLLSIAERELNVFGLALESAYGTQGPIENYSFAGKTDHQIVFELLSSAGWSAADIESGLPDMKARYFEMLDGMLDAASMQVLPGVIELLDELETESSAVLGLQTGNWEVAAEIKLGRFGLEGYFPAGAFGDGNLDRNALPPLARERAERYLDRKIEPSRTVVLGDTALDVACARAWGMASVGVATGSACERDLEAAGADLVLSTLAGLDAKRLFELTREESS